VLTGTVVLEGGKRGRNTILDRIVLKRSSNGQCNLGTRKVGSGYGAVDENTERSNRAEGA
jgi:hypothetical protein